MTGGIRLHDTRAQATRVVFGLLSGMSGAATPHIPVDAKLSILLASLIAGLLGYLWLRFAGTRAES